MSDLLRPRAVPTHPRWIDAERVTVPARSIIWPRMTFAGDDAVFLGRAGDHGVPFACDVDAPSTLLVGRPGVAQWGDVVAYAYGVSFVVARDAA